MVSSANNEASLVASTVQRLVRGDDLSREIAEHTLGVILAGRADPILIAGFLTALTAKGETADEMAGFVDAMMAAATTFSIGPEVMDMVGTGGDQLHSVNITTMAALAVAGCGVPVAKHGNRAASSSVGSADVLEGLGVRLDVPEDVVRACVEQANIGFLFAPTYHHALATLGPIRRALGFRTVFNILGPLANPARVTRTLVGVAHESLLERMARVLQQRGVRHGALVHGDDGLDELSLAGPSTIYRFSPEGHVVQRLDAGADLGRRHDVTSLRGGDVSDNVLVVRDFLSGKTGPVFDVVCANAGLALVVAGRADDIVEGYELASSSVLEGRAHHALEQLVTLTNA